jgi:hypothetical protein
MSDQPPPPPQPGWGAPRPGPPRKQPVDRNTRRNLIALGVIGGVVVLLVGIATVVVIVVLTTTMVLLWRFERAYTDSPPPTTEELAPQPSTCQEYRMRDHADYQCDGDYFAVGSQIPDDAPMSLRPPASGPCPLGYPPASHFMCTTPTIPPEQWPQSP